MARRFAAFCLLALACAGSPSAAPPGGAVSQSALENALWGLELSFVDPNTLDRHQTVGPYRILGWEPGRMQIEGVDALAHVPRQVTLLENGDEIWAFTRIGPHEFLARIR